MTTRAPYVARLFSQDLGDGHIFGMLTRRTRSAGPWTLRFRANYSDGSQGELHQISRECEEPVALEKTYEAIAGLERASVTTRGFESPVVVIIVDSDGHEAIAKAMLELMTLQKWVATRALNEGKQ